MEKKTNPGVAAANAARWAGVDAETRSKKMSKLATIKHKTLTPEARKALGRRLKAARKKAFLNGTYKGKHKNF